MVRQRIALVCLVTSCLASCARPSQPLAPEPPSHSEASVLPLVRLRLYASGVGYFERRGDLTVGQRSVPVPTGHLDDALKTLMVLGDEHDALSISFPSRLSSAVARARAGLPAAEDAALSYDRLFAALRGEEVEVELSTSAQRASGGATRYRGHVVEVVAVEPSHPGYDHGPPQRTLPKGQAEAKEQTRLHVVLLTEEQALRRLDLSEVAAVRPLDPRVAERLQAAMSARKAGRSNQSQWLDLTGGGKVRRDVRLAYLAETPTWRSSYRLLLTGPKDAARRAASGTELQGWALVHNDTEEAWRGVKLELVDGYPSSFLFPLAAPRYQRRPLETPDSELSSVPQLSTATPDAMWGDFSDYQGETIETLSGYEGGGSSFGMGNLGGGGTGEGYGSGAGGLGSSRTVTQDQPSDLLWVGDLVAEAGVTPKAERAISIYRLSQTLDLAPRHSALLPFLNTPVAARSIVWFSGTGARAERAVSISNDTTHSLPAGPLAVYRDGGFMGEAVLEGLQPGARQFARIGDEPDTELDAKTLETSEQRVHVSYHDQTFSVHAVRSRRARWVFDNRTGRSAETYVGLSLVRNAVLTGADRIDYDSTTRTSFAVFVIPPGASKTRQIATEEALRKRTALQELEVDNLQELVEDEDLPSAEREILRQAIPAIEARKSVVDQLEELEVERRSLDQDLERLRQDARSLASKESGEASRALTQRLLERHDELRALESQQRALDKKLATRTDQLGAILSRLTLMRSAILQERERLMEASKRKGVTEQ